MHPRPALLMLPLAALSVIAGCRLVDQRTFEGTGLFPGSSQLHAGDYAARALPAPPLAVVRLSTPGTDWQATLVAAARAAQARKPDVEFDVVAPFPATATLAVQESAQRQGAADAARVAAVLEADDISADRIHLGARSDAGQPPREVEVYVR